MRIKSIRVGSRDYNRTFRITAVNDTTVALFDEEKKAVVNQSYSRDYLTHEKWQIIVSLVECPECGLEKSIPDGDFLCSDCRKAIPIEARIIAEKDGELIIAYLSGTNTGMTLSAENLSVVLKREDIGPNGMEVLRRFLDG